MNILKRIVNRIWFSISVLNPKLYTFFLRSKGCRVGNVWWGNLKTISIDYSRPLLVDIGDNVRINTGFTLMTHDGATMIFRNLYKDFVPSSGLVKIGNNVYFGRNCTVLKGVTIGDNCIIGYGSLVVKDIPGNSVVAGVPAKVICSVDDYYKKRKEKSLEEAFLYAQRIKNVYNRKPTIEDMYEEFPFYLDGDSDIKIKKSIQYQTRGFYNHWKKNHKAMFSSFDDFLKAAGVE